MAFSTSSPHRRRVLLAALALVVASVLTAASGRALAAGKKKKGRARATPTPVKPTATPTPTPIPLQRAAGSCMRFVPEKMIFVAEVGETGRIFQVDDETILTVTPKLGTRVRILYVDVPGEAPLAKKIMPGPEEAKAP